MDRADIERRQNDGCAHDRAVGGQVAAGIGEGCGVEAQPARIRRSQHDVARPGIEDEAYRDPADRSLDMELAVIRHGEEHGAAGCVVLPGNGLTSRRIDLAQYAV